MVYMGNGLLVDFFHTDFLVPPMECHHVSQRIVLRNDHLGPGKTP